MKKYNIEIEEVFQNVYEIEASCLREALGIARERYRNGKYILKEEDLKETCFRECEE